MRRGANERLAAWVTFLQAHSVLVDALERDLMTARGLHLSWYEVLLHLGLAPDGRLRMLDLSRSLLLSKSGVTRLVDRMEASGLVARRPSPRDRRVTWAAITPVGRRALRGAVPVHLRGVEEHFVRHLGSEEVRTLRRMLRKVLTANGYPEEACRSPADFDRVTEPAARREPATSAGGR